MLQKRFSEKDIDSMMAFVAAVTEVCKEVGQNYVFRCPICGGEAHAVKDRCNGHRSGICATCGTKMME